MLGMANISVYRKDDVVFVFVTLYKPLLVPLEAFLAHLEITHGAGFKPSTQPAHSPPAVGELI